MRNFLILSAAIFLAMSNPVHATEQFFEAIPDVPLMEGLEEMPGEAVIFDKPQGRIVETLARLDTASKEQVNAWYQETLPQLGWSEDEENIFEREAEILRLSYEQHEGRTYLKLAVSPRD